MKGDPMRARLVAVLCLAAVIAFGAGAALAETTIEVQYPYAHLFDKTHKIISEAFAKDHPDIKLKFRGAYENYEDASQKVLKEAITKRLPDVSFQGLNRVRILVEKGIAQPLEPFIAREKSFSREGYHKAMLAIGTYGGKVYSLPFAVSLPVSYYNIDLVKKAGGDPDNLPKTWDEVIALAKKINAMGDDNHGMFFGWTITGNWFWQALNFSHGGSMLTPDEKKVAFGGPVGQWSIKTFARFSTEAGMPNLGHKDCAQVFAAGKVGMFFWSTSILARMTEWVGDKFELKTGPLPGCKTRRRAAGRRQRRGHVLQGPQKAGGRLEVHQVRHQRQGRGGGGQDHRLHAPQQKGERSLPEGLLPETSQPHGRGEAASLALQLVRLPGQKRPQDHQGHL